MLLNNQKFLPINVHYLNQGRLDLNKLKNFNLLINQRENWRFFLINGLKLAFKEFEHIKIKNNNFIIDIVFQEKFLFFKQIRQDYLKKVETFGYNIFIPIIINQKILNKKNNINLTFFKWLDLGILPSLSPKTSFYIDGISRAVSTQKKKSPGLIFDFDLTKKSSLAKVEGEAYLKILAPRGSWFKISYSEEHIIFIEIRNIAYKIPIFTFLCALGLSLESIFQFFNYNINFFKLIPNKYDSTNALIKARNDIFILYSDLLPLLNKSNKIVDIKYLINHYFFSYIWNSKTRYCGEATRLHLYNKVESPLPLNSLFLEEIDFIYITKNFIYRLINNNFKDDNHDNLKNMRFRNGGDYIYLQTRQGLFDFENFLNVNIHSIQNNYLYSNIITNKKKEDIYSIQEKNNVKIFSLNQIYFLKQILHKSWKSFFLSGTLSQFAENLNPLSYITHARRFTSLGPGSLNKAEASIEVRSINSSYNGRVCPIETPEGFNAGLVHSFSLYSFKGLNGELLLPFYFIYKNIKQNYYLPPVFFNIEEESNQPIITGDLMHEKWNGFLNKKLSLRNNFHLDKNYLSRTSFQSLSPYHLISLATSLIPFLEHNDANRALMGSNMQRQTVPVLGANNFIVRTGLDTKLFSDISSIPISQINGFNFESNYNYSYFYKIDNLITLNNISYNYIKKTNHNSLYINESIKKKNRWHQQGDFLINNSVIENGKLALGPNLLLAYLPWHGYNYEDAIIINERCVSQKILTSLHIIKLTNSLELAYREINKKKEFFYEVPVKLEIIFSLFAPFYYNLKYYKNSEFINFEKKNPYYYKNNINIGTFLKKGDCIFSKCRIRFSFSRDLMLQYKELFILLRETFPTFEDFKIFANIFAYDKYKQKLDRKKPKKYTRLKADNFIFNKNSTLFKKHKLKALINYYNIEDSTIYAEKDQEGIIISKHLKKVPMSYTSITPFDLEEFLSHNESKKKEYYNLFFTKSRNIEILQLRDIQLGDKCAGRHGNKGIISKICPINEMPLLPDGTPIDIILNPLGIPSRMNVGQIFESLLGLAGYYLNETYTINIFDEQFGLEASRSFVLSKLYKASILSNKPWLFLKNNPGKANIIDGLTGKFFQQPITIGYSSILKLIHMVTDKLHGRSIGGYSTLTLQPTKGKSLLGGQRVGEMELWALQGYGASWALQELYTLKSDLLEARQHFQNYINSFNIESNIYDENNISLNELESLIISDTFKPYTLECFLEDLKALCIYIDY